MEYSDGLELAFWSDLYFCIQWAIFNGSLANETSSQFSFFNSVKAVILPMTSVFFFIFYQDGLALATPPSTSTQSPSIRVNITSVFTVSSKRYSGSIVFLELLFPFSQVEPSKPRFVIQPTSQDNIVTEKKVNFSCEALGIPRPAITWFKNGCMMPVDMFKQTEALSVLTIESVEPQDQGQYWCEANSDEGASRSADANLTGN